MSETSKLEIDLAETLRIMPSNKTRRWKSIGIYKDLLQNKLISTVNI